MAAHLPRILEAAGATTAQAVAASALVGPSQVASRLLEAGVLKRFHPLLSARIATFAHPIGAVALGLLGAGAGSATFAILHGSGNGILTIARGTVPLAVFGPAHYGYRLSLIGSPARIAQAGSPLIFGLALDALGVGAVIISSILYAAALVCLCAIKQREPATCNRQI
jgi:hypothetical protein